MTANLVVEKLYPPVKAGVDWLRDYGKPLMTGTGASVFCRWDRQSEAQEV